MPGSNVKLSYYYLLTEALKDAGYKLHEIDELDVRWKTFALAKYLQKQRLEAVLSKKQADKQREQARKASRRGRPGPIA